MPSESRRAILHIGSCAAVAGLAGCTDLLESNTETSLSFLLFRNFTADERCIDLEITEENEEIYHETVCIEPGSTEVVHPDKFHPNYAGDPPRERSTDDEFWEPFPTEAGPHKLTFDFHGRDDEHGISEFDFEEYDKQCVGFRAELSDRSHWDNDEPRLLVFDTTGCEQGGPHPRNPYYDDSN